MPHVTAHGVDIPVLGFGTWDVHGESAYRSVRAALEVGYRHVDTAQSYRNETQVGRAIVDSGVDRDDVFLVTKVATANAAPVDVDRSTQESLSRLGVDHVDLLLVHWPSDRAPIEATVEALDEQRQKGRTRLIGVSNYPSALLRRALAIAPVATDQVEHHVLLGQDAVQRVLDEHGLPLTAYSPLARGVPFDRPELVEIAEAHGRTPAQVALRWLLQRPGRIAIPRSENPEHIAANFDVLDFELSDEQMRRLDALPKDQRLVNPPFAPAWD
jgi:diketogulonate reductase-like aldo/keto reductase